MEKYKFDFWFEWGCGEDFCPCLWSTNSFAKEKYGYCVNINDLPISDDLTKFLYLLGIEHDNALDWSCPQNDLCWTESEEKEFYAKAWEGYKRLKKELGPNYHIKYCEKK